MTHTEALSSIQDLAEDMQLGSIGRAPLAPPTVEWARQAVREAVDAVRTEVELRDLALAAGRLSVEWEGAR